MFSSNAAFPLLKFAFSKDHQLAPNNIPGRVVLLKYLAAAGTAEQRGDERGEVGTVLRSNFEAARRAYLPERTAFHGFDIELYEVSIATYRSQGKRFTLEAKLYEARFGNQMLE